MDFAGGNYNGQILDKSAYGNNAKVMGNPTFTDGGSPITEYESMVPSYMVVNGVSDYLVIDHTDALALGQNNADFTVSFALL